MSFRKLSHQAGGAFMAGFTLIEVLASMLVFSLAIIGLSSAGTQSAVASRVLQQKAIAGIIADNVLIDARRERPFTTGSQGGEQEQMGQNYFWSLQIEPTEMEGFFRITVQVKAPDAEQVILRREAYKAATQ